MKKRDTRKFPNPYISITIGDGYTKFVAVADSIENPGTTREISGGQPYRYKQKEPIAETLPPLSIVMNYIIGLCNNWAGSHCSFEIFWENRKPDLMIEYLFNGGNTCLGCGKKNTLEACPFDGEGAWVTSEVECTECGSGWTDHYKLSGVSDMELTNGRATVRGDRKD